MADARQSARETLISLKQLGDGALIFSGTLALVDGDEAVRRYGMPRET